MLQFSLTPCCLGLSHFISMCILPLFSSFSPAQRQIAHHSLWLYSTLLSFHYSSLSPFVLFIIMKPSFLSFLCSLLYIGSLSAQAHFELVFRSHIRKTEQDGVCVAVQRALMCSNLIFSFDLVKLLYLEYMSLFKFMRSDGVLSVIGIIYALS